MHSWKYLKYVLHNAKKGHYYYYYFVILQALRLPLGHNAFYKSANNILTTFINAFINIYKESTE